jgi:Leucine-rich repeat (LRR) protein
MADKKDFTSAPARNTLQKAVAIWEELNQRKLCDEEVVDLIFRNIADLDNATINYFKACRKLSLSSNFIQKIPDIHLENLQILSLGRNKIK